MKMNRHLLAILLLFAFVLNCSAQSIAEAARKERERQKNLKSTVTVVGGTKVESKAGTPATKTTAPAAAPVVKPVEALDNNGRNEQYWRTAFQKARDDAKRAEDRVRSLDLNVKNLNTQLLTRTDIYNRENVIGPEIAAAQKELEDARKEAEQAKQRITNLEDELRKAGGPAGWAR
jgi:BMFP domain-containing protein YqiC